MFPQKSEQPEDRRFRTDEQVRVAVQKTMRERLNLQTVSRNLVVSELESREPLIHSLIEALRGRDNADYTWEQADVISKRDFPGYSLADLKEYHDVWKQELEKLSEENRQFKKNFPS